MSKWIEATAQWLGDGGNDTFSQFYADSLRSNLFAGFLTLCAFLFSVKTFLLVTLEKDVYGTQRYGRRIERLRQVNPQLTRYGQLKRLNGTLFRGVCLTFAAAILQLTIGLIDANWAALICVAISCVAAVYFGINLVVQRVVLADWLTFLEDRHDDIPEEDGGRPENPAPPRPPVSD